MASSKHKLPHFRLQNILAVPHLLPLLLLLLTVCSQASAFSSLTTAKPGLLSSALSAASSSSSSGSSTSSGSALASALTSAATSGAGSSASQSGALGAASNFLYNVIGAPAPTSSNPYPIRTMIGNLYFRLSKHKTPIMIIPPLVRLMYQFRQPIMKGVSSAFQGLSAAAPVAKGVAETAGVAAASQALPMLAQTFAANPAAGGLMFPGPFAGGIPMALPSGVAPVFQPAVYRRK